MTEQGFRIVEECYGIMIILVRGVFLGFLINTFISDDVMDKAKKIVLSTVVTLEGTIIFMVPISTKGAWTVISLLTILAVFFFYDKTIMPHIVFVYFLWQNMFFVWYIVNIVISDYLSVWLTQSIDYSQPKALSYFFGMMMAQMVLEILFLTIACIAIYKCIEKLCVQKQNMSWTEALFLSIYSGVSYVIAYMIAEVMVVPLEKEVFILLDEKKNLKIALPILAVLIFIGEMSAIATWQRYRRLKEEELLLQEQIREQDYLRKKIEYSEKYHDEIRTMRHDMAGKLMILKSFLENNRYQDASQFLGEMDIELNAGGVKYSTGNPVTDVVINEAASQAEKLGCAFECELSFPKGKSISAMDMAIVLNNLLDNALEAVAAIPEEERFMKISGTLKDNFYLLKTENSFDGKVIRAADNSIISKKKDSSDSDLHGIGLKSIMSIADKYLGAVDIKTENRVFAVKVMLQNTGN